MKLDNPALLIEKNLLEGQWIGADSGATLSVKNVATGEEIASVPRLGRAETQRAIAYAEQAQRE